MKKFTLYLLLVIAFYSCSNEQDIIEPQKGDITRNLAPQKRLVFKSLEEMDSITSSLDLLNFVEQKEWSKKRIINPATEAVNSIRAKDVSYFERINSFKAILNADLEFQIQDSVMWYNNNSVYFLGLESNKELNKLKSNYSNLPLYYKYDVEPLALDNALSRAATNFVLIGGKGGYSGTTTCKTFTIGNLPLTPNQLRTYEYLTYEPEVDYPNKETYYDHQLKFTLYCERREKGYLAMHKSGMQTYKIYLKMNVFKRMIMDGQINEYLLFVDGSFKGNIDFSSPIDYTVHRRAKGAMTGGRDEWYSGYAVHYIKVNDLSTMGDQIFIYQTGDGYSSLNWVYNSYDFTITLKYFGGEFSFTGLGAAAPKIAFSSLN